MRQIGVDVGGTFTDLAFSDTETGRFEIHKLPSTPDDPSRAVIDGINQLCAQIDLPRAALDKVIHGTTVATNAILEYDGAEAGMITNAGFRDIVHIGRHQRPQHYSIAQDIPWQSRPLVKRRFRKTVGGRLVPPFGAELEALDEAGVRTAAEELRDAGIRSIAICFLFSFLNNAHEERAAEIVREVIPDAFVTTSSSVTQQFREFERFTTNAMNAFVGPKVRTYVQRLEAALKDAGYGCDLHIMASNGGIATAQTIIDNPVLTLMSGPAAGVIGGAFVGAASKRDRLITFDVGGTSADIGIVVDGKYAEATARDTEIAGYPVLVPMIDVHTIGAGGGSIAYRDKGGAFCVGPRSAGARPGPAAYGHGGTSPTVTDANVVLGRLDSDNFLGQGMRLDVAAAQRVIGALAETLGLDPLEAAAGVQTVVNANMANLIRTRTVQKGLDPREFTLVAFGGGGPLQAIEVADGLGIPDVLIPPAPGINSAIGLLTTDIRYDEVRTTFEKSTAFDLPRFAGIVRGMAGLVAASLARDGFAPEATRTAYAADLRYEGQGYELRVDLDPGLDAAAVTRLFADFEALHEAEYGKSFPGNPIEVVNVRVIGRGLVPKFRGLTHAGGPDFDACRIGAKPVVFRRDGVLTPVDTPIYERRGLPLCEGRPGPALIVQKDTTTYVRPEDSFTVEANGNLIVHVNALAGTAAALRAAEEA
ncbi:hydantoinase/oxoprolinase family protein [Frigidibacter sp. MR17.24]|uniref:hydantoinase/oxoprolinase family protein n=1 Tax=Frigidibacter sp. MR17.24 TaxID=3127345 RepID=UPI00301308B1